MSFEYYLLSNAIKDDSISVKNIHAKQVKSMNCI